MRTRYSYWQCREDGTLWRTGDGVYLWADGQWLRDRFDMKYGDAMFDPLTRIEAARRFPAAFRKDDK